MARNRKRIVFLFSETSGPNPVRLSETARAFGQKERTPKRPNWWKVLGGKNYLRMICARSLYKSAN